ncbi:GntR family transcriptional regulator [Calidifontibacter sp. DB0510]|uniref:GntR family transcriptional regulator n=1 Tax=Metallococcus carri TaxID=1656884 RepID=A0A967B0C4_9MICO|nr:GntR family transcriptional regulator [Metallococcus carri]NHN54925.1 GntR family transcriptional regulator [Metallococcus carri]NOP37271.1 GntR family transcriptional regulator [Calidifontibacter sp. DB2511S]
MDPTHPILAGLRRPERYATGPDVLRELRRVIVSGQVVPGTFVPVDDVAAFFQVSRIPVREALKTLIGEGLVAHEQRGGYTVTLLSAEELSELYVVRGALEAAATAAAVRNARAADDRRAREAHDTLGAAIADGDAAAYQRHSRGFHEALLSSCGMPRLLHMLEVAWNLTEPMQPMTLLEPGQLSELHAEHQQMLDAFLARDADRLAQLSAQHQGHLTTYVEGATQPGA